MIFGMDKMDKIRDLEVQIERLKRIAVQLKVDVNIRDAKIVELEQKLVEAHARERGMMRNTQTMNKLEILGESNDDDGGSPYDTGRFKSPWEKVR